MISHYTIGGRAAVISVLFGIATLCASGARANKSVFDMDPACGPIAAATKRLPSLTDYAEWPAKLRNKHITRVDWKRATYLHHLDVIEAWSQTASRTRSEDQRTLYQTLIADLASGKAKISQTMVVFSPNDKTATRVYGIERPAIGRGPISRRPAPDFNRHYRLWSIIVESDRASGHSYDPISTESDGSVLIAVNRRAVLVIPSLASIFSITAVYPAGFVKTAICASLRNKYGGLE